MNEARLHEDTVKQEVLNILLRFDEIARGCGLSYSLAYGTLLGAVRHKGFIPWDDDIDVMMSRPDYDQLIELVKKGGLEIPGHRFVGYELGNHPFPFLKLQNTSIAVCENYHEGHKDEFLWIDIFPLDGVPSDDTKFRAFWGRARRKKLQCLMGSISAASGANIAKKVIKFCLKLYCKHLGGAKRAANSLLDMAHCCSYANSSYVANVAWGPYGLGERMLKNEFEQLESLEFEGRLFPAVKNYDAYLSRIYGDYMKLPPATQRVSHGVVAWRVESQSASS